MTASWAGSAAYAPLFLQGHHFVGTRAAPAPPSPGTGIVLTGNPNSAAMGRLVTFEAIVSPLPAAGSMVQFVDQSKGNAVLGQGAVDAGEIARCSTGTLAVGTHAIVGKLSPTPMGYRLSNILNGVIIAPAPAPPAPPPSPPGAGDFRLPRRPRPRVCTPV